MTRSMTAKDLKAALAANDAALRASLGRLTGTRLAGTGGTSADLARLGASAAGTAVQTARAYPWATAAVGAGLAWLAFAAGTRAKTAPEPKAEALTRWEDEGGQPVPAGEIEAIEDEVEDWMMAAAAARDAARDRLLALFEAGRATAEARAEVAADLAQDLAEAFRHNLADLTEDAAARVTEARKAAWDAMEKSRDLARDGYRRGKVTARRHPVAATALGLTVGAGLLAALAPRTRPLMARAAPVALTALLAQGAALFWEQDKAKDTAKDAADDLADAVKGAKKKVSHKAETATKAAVKAARPAAAKTRTAAKTVAKPAPKTRAKPATKVTAKAAPKTAPKASGKTTPADSRPNGAVAH